MLRRFDRKDLERALNDTRLLTRLIEESSGYVLARMRQEGLMPDLDRLMDRPCAKSLSFILDHYELNDEQRRSLAPLFQRETGNERLAGGAWGEERLERALLAGEPLPRSAVIPIKLLLALPRRVEAQKAFGEHEFGKMLKRSVESLSVEEFLGLDRGLLSANHGLFEACARHYVHPEFKMLSREVGQERQGGPVPLDGYRSWPFGPQDRDFLFELLARKSQEARSRAGWSLVEELNGANKLIDPMEFFRRFNPRDIDMLDDEQVEANKAEIQAAWLSVAGEEAYARASRLIACKCSAKSFEKVFDAGFAKKLLELEVFGLDFNSIWQDDSESRSKLASMKRALTEAAAAEPERFVSKLGMVKLSRAIRDVVAHSDMLGEKAVLEARDYADRMSNAFLPWAVPTFAPGFCELRQAAEDWTGSALLPSFSKWALRNPSVNALWAVGHGWRAHSKHGGWEQQRMAAAIAQVSKKLSTRVDCGSAKMALADAGMPHQGWGDGMLGMGLRVLSAASGKRGKRADNFLDVDYGDFARFPLDLQELLARADDRFVGRIKMAGAEPGEMLLLGLLGQSTKRSTLTLSKVVALDPARAMSMPTFASTVLAHRDAAKIVDVKRWASPPSWMLVEKMLALLAEAKGASARAEAALPEDSLAYEDEDEDDEEAVVAGAGSLQVSPERAAAAKLSALVRTAAEELSRVLVSMPHGAVANGIGLALEEGRFADVAALARAGLPPSQEIGSRLRAKVESMARTGLCEALAIHGSDGDALRAAIKGSVAYGGRGSWELDAGSPESNHRLAHALMPLFGSDPLYALSLFSGAVAAGFSNEFAIENFPELIFYRYELAPCGPKQLMDRRHAVGRPYSNEQVIKIWDRMEARGGAFAHADINADYSHFISANFEGDPQRYLECRQLAKSRPKLYCLLSHSLAEECCMRELIEQEALASNREEVQKNMPGRDELRAMFCRRWTDWAVAQEGMAQTFDEMSCREGDEGFNSKLANRAIDQAIWSTYAQVEDVQGNKRREPSISEEQSHQMLAMICSKAPLRLYEVSQLGAFESVGARLASHGRLYFEEDAIDRFVFPPTAHEAEHYSLREWLADSARGVGLALAHWMLSEGRSEDARFLDWWLREDSFRKGELAGRPGMGGTGMWDYHRGVADFMAGDPEVSAVLRVAFERMSLQEIAVAPGARRSKVSARL